LHYQIAIHGKNDLPFAPDEATGFTMTLLRMLAFRPAADESGGTQRPAPRMAPVAAQAATPRAAVGAGPVASSREEPPAPKVSAPRGGGLTAAEPAAAAPAAGEIVSAAPAGTFDGDWTALIARLPLTGFVRAWAVKSEMAAFEKDVFALRVATDKLAADKPMQDKLRAAIEQYLGRPVRLAVSVGGLNGESIAAIEEKKNDARQQAAEAAIMNDPFVRDLIAKTGTRATNIEPRAPAK
jgi:DNA polymerase-3 subunit gamma/tau